MPSKQNTTKDNHKITISLVGKKYNPDMDYMYEHPTGVKHDKEKRQWALLPWREIGIVADVMTHGAKKYSPDNWMHVPAGERRYFEAAMRHITARQNGEIRDPESKLPHLAHAICCLLFWMWFDGKNRRGHK